MTNHELLTGCNTFLNFALIVLVWVAWRRSRRRLIDIAEYLRWWKSNFVKEE